ncbi:MAG: hypothetical protein ACP5GH_06810, partial [Nitrososphaeria archaeon]
PSGLLLSLISYAIFLLTYEPLFGILSTRPRASQLVLLLPDAAPPLFAIALKGLRVLAGLLPSALLLSGYLWLSLRGRGRSAEDMVLGSSALAGLYFYYLSLLGPISPLGVVVGIVFLAYNASQVLYVESRLSFRSLSPEWPLAALLPGLLAGLFISPCLLIPLAEPLVKATSNALNNRKISGYEEIRRLGKAELARYVIFVALLSALAALCPGAVHPHAPGF